MSNNAMIIESEKLYTPKIKNLKAVQYDGRTYTIIDNDQNTYEVKNYDVELKLRKVSQDTLKKMLFTARLKIKEIGSDYGISLHQPLPGGGPVAGAIAYWLTKIICYAGAGGAAVGAVEAVGGTVGSVANFISEGGAVVTGAAGTGGTSCALMGVGASSAAVSGGSTAVGFVGAKAFTASATATKKAVNAMDSEKKEGAAAAIASVVAVNMTNPSISQKLILVGFEKVSSAALGSGALGKGAASLLVGNASAASFCTLVESASASAGAFFTALPIP